MGLDAIRSALTETILQIRYQGLTNDRRRSRPESHIRFGPCRIRSVPTSSGQRIANAAANVDYGQDFDASDSPLVHVVKRSETDAQIDQPKCCSLLTAARIRTNIVALAGFCVCRSSSAAVCFCDDSTECRLISWPRSGNVRLRWIRKQKTPLLLCWGVFQVEFLLSSRATEPDRRRGCWPAGFSRRRLSHHRLRLL